jgi:anion-transporting  ArsA/GET3 family ATPase
MTGRARTEPTRRRRGTPRRIPPATAAGTLGVDELIDDPATRIIVCCGSGGVGKTTTAAALALRAAERGRKAVVLTIDPARRLAQSMGLSELDNVPRAVQGTDGRLDAMMLDMKRTFDEVVEAHASPERAQQILTNPFYIALSSSFAGTQEYMAMEKLSQLSADAAATGRWDLIVVDTPPSRSALDFLDAPARLSSLLDGRFIKLMLAPARGPARFFSAGFGLVTAALNKILGSQVLRDVQTFIAAFDTLFGGFRARAEKTYQLLRQEGTSFVVVAAPEPDALREAAYFVERLSQEGMPLAGMVINRMTTPADGLSGHEAGLAADRLLEAAPEPGDDAALVGAVLAVHAAHTQRCEREQRLVRRFRSSHADVATVSVPALAGDVHDLTTLRQIGALLATG